MKFAYTFPGQGSQSVGMGQALAEAFPAAREVFQEVDDALGQALSRLMWEGPDEDLTLTENAQPALMAVSVAVMRVLEREAGARCADAVCVAGHSLGEYAALTAAGALTLADAARLLKIRGRAMQAAVPVGEGAMAALLGLDIETAERAISEAPGEGVCEVANDNAPGQVVVSGARRRVEAVIETAKALGAKRAMLLPVSAPFHCSLMAPAADRMAEALADAALAPPRVDVFANVTAAPERDAETIRELLIAQITGRVRWRESVTAMVEAGAETFVEAGAGKVLTGLARRIAKQAQALNVGTPTELDRFFETCL